MKRLLGIVGLVLGFTVLAHAGTPVENLYMSQPPLSNTTILGSSNTINTIGITIAPPTVNNGGTTQQCRNCFTRIVMGLTAGASYYTLDGGTTVQFVLGGQIGSSGGVLSLPEDHLGPLCLTSGQTTTIKILGAVAPSNFVNYEGYTQCGGTNNAGPMY